MPQEKLTLGQAIDHVVQALSPLDEDARQTVLMTVCAHLHIHVEHKNLGVLPGAAATAAPPVVLAIPPAAAAATPRRRVDIRALRDEKKPVSAKQMACLVAFYLQEHAPADEKKESISSSDLEKYFKQAGFKLPQRMQQVLPDAKSSGYFDSAARGEYKLNAVGYNLVAHNLPPTTSGA